MKKLAVLFPGIGYHADKPLLYYSQKLLRSMDYEVMPLTYAPLPQEREQAVRQALVSARQALAGVPFAQYGEIVLVGKSIGTCVAGVIGGDLSECLPEIRIRNVFFTPVTQPLPRMTADTLVLSGTADPLADQTLLRAACTAAGALLHTVLQGNHSLETPDVMQNLKILYDALEWERKFLVDRKDVANTKESRVKK